jgi:TPR repeat protein
MGEGATLSQNASDDRAAVRAKLLDAARAVAERDGVEAVTIARIAEETAMPRATVMGQFARREDILMSIVSDDLTNLARTMKDVDWPKGGDTPEEATVLQLPLLAEVPAIEAPADEPEETPAADTAPAPQSAPSTTRQRLPRRGDLAQLLEGKSAGEDSEAKEGPSRAPDAWLERRLRVFERAMTAMETRQAEVEKNARAAAATAEEAIKALQATVDELKDRADATDARHKSSANEIRAALNETALRVQTVEGVARAALAENKPAAEPEAAAPVEVELHPVVQAEAAVAATDEASAGEPVAADGPKSFIAEARKSAIAAGVAAAEEETKEAPSKARRSITRYLLGGMGMMVVFVAAAGMAFSKGVDDGRRDALSHVKVVMLPHIGAAGQTALDRLTARAQAGDVTAEFQVGLRYLSGATKDPRAAMRWMTMAAAHGQPVAEYVLGTMYSRGNGATADAARALQWYEAAALQGNRKAMHALAVAYAEGEGVAKSPSEAVRWFSRAAGLGYVDSQFNLAVLYERGMGVPQSLLDAYKWYAVAARAGDAEAKERLEALKTQLGADDLAAAQRAADAFHAVPFDAAANSI